MIPLHRHTNTNQNSLVIGIALAAVALVFGGVLWFSASQVRPPAALTNNITVAVTIFPLADIAKNVGGDLVNIVQIVPAGASPHNSALTPQQLTEVQGARALFAIGHGLDDRIVQSLRDATGVPMAVVIVDQNIQLRMFNTDHDREEARGETDREDSSIDPHYWLTAPNAQNIAATIAATLQEIDPEHEATYADNLAKYTATLGDLETELQTAARQAPHQELLAVHDAWSYFADHYGFTLLATYEPFEGKEPSIDDIRELQALIRQRGIRTFFTEPQKESTGAAQLLRGDLGLQIEVLDPIGGIGRRDSYVNMMQENMAAIASG
jgi:ABC-type Zn uptake system ZnuABC Zn-binding protein ZnuA